MGTYAELLAQRAELERQIEAARVSEIKQAISTVRELVAQFSLTAQDVFQSGKTRAANASSKTSGKVAAKYKDPVTGATWTGRGKAPKWIDGKSRDQFLI